MIDAPASAAQTLLLAQALTRLARLTGPALLDAVRADQADRWRAGEAVLAEVYLDGLPGLTANPEDALVLLCGELLLRGERGEVPALAEYQTRFPHLAERLELLFLVEKAFGTSANILAPEPTVGGTPAPPAPVPAAPLGYEILAELGQGGMGVVYKAHHRALNRVVALKLLLGGALARPEQLARFRAEAEAVARLQHPNVVQVFEVGEYDGRPFLALEFVDGPTLARKCGRTPQPAREAARLVETLARAVHEAHRHGIIHRDLKPANVLLTTNGVPKVADFGLAKRLEGGGNLTATEAFLGTPSYMAPEQAEGRARDVGPAADVYALGAILYELLTGRPPFEGETPLETMRRVVAEAPVSPRRLVPEVPRDLETIGLKCLHKEPHQRYPSALELAEDLGRFLAGESIRARPAGMVEQLGRWCRRRPLVAGLSAGLLLVFLAGFSGVTHQWLAAERERQRAEAGYRKARQAVDECFLRATEDPALQGPAMARVRQLLLETTLAYYQDFLAEHAGDSALKREAAETYARVGTITYEVGRKLDSLAAFEESRRLWQELAPGSRDPTPEQGLASSLDGLAQAQRVLGLRDEALRTSETAQSIWERLALETEGRNAQKFQGALAATSRTIGALHHEAGRRDEAFRCYEQARTLLEKLIAEDVWNPNLAHDLVLTTNNLGLLYRQAGRWEEALRAHEHARALLDGLLSREPGDSRFRGELAKTWHLLAILQEEAGRSDKALAAYEQASRMRAQLVAAYPVVEYQRGLAETLDNLGDVHKEGGRQDEALRSYRQSRDIWEGLIASDSADTRFRGDLAICLNRMGELYHETRSPGEAVRCYEQARELLKTLIREDPGDTLLQLTLAENLYLGSQLCREPGRRDEALRLCEEARAVLEKLVQKDRADIRFRDTLADCLARAGRLHGDAGRWDKALPLGDEVLRLRAALAADSPKRRAFQKGLARAYLDRATLRREAGRQDQALRDLEQARDAWEKLLADNGRDHDAHSRLGVTLQHLGTLLQERGRLQEALAVVQGAVEHQGKALSLAPKKVEYQELLDKHAALRAAWQKEQGRSADK